MENTDSTEAIMIFFMQTVGHSNWLTALYRRYCLAGGWFWFKSTTNSSALKSSNAVVFHPSVNETSALRTRPTRSPFSTGIPAEGAYKQMTKDGL